MAQFLQIHPENPQARLIQQAVEVVRSGGVIIYPTDSAYALGCQIGNKQALERIRRIRQVDETHHLTLVCRDLADIGNYANIQDNAIFRLIKKYTPGPYTFLLKASKEVPRQLQHPKRKTIGVRIPDNKIVQALLAELNEPLMSSTLIMPNEIEPLTDPEMMQHYLGKQVDLIIDGGFCGSASTTVLDLFNDMPLLVRQGKGEWNE